jgi:hypothetical protein
LEHTLHRITRNSADCFIIRLSHSRDREVVLGGTVRVSVRLAPESWRALHPAQRNIPWSRTPAKVAEKWDTPSHVGVSSNASRKE